MSTIRPQPIDSSPVDSTSPAIERAPPSRREISPASTSSTETDRVTISSALAPRPSSSASVVPVDNKKVEEVRRAIAEGRFPVDAKRVAESLLANSVDLFHVKPSSGS